MTAAATANGDDYGSDRAAATAAAAEEIGWGMRLRTSTPWQFLAREWGLQGGMGWNGMEMIGLQ